MDRRLPQYGPQAALQEVRENGGSYPMQDLLSAMLATGTACDH
jgi:hypothetical protein